SVPTVSSYLTLAEQNGKLLAIWVDPMRPGHLMVRTMNYTRQNSPWSAPSDTLLPDNEQVPGASRFFSVMLDQTLYVLWTVPTTHANGATTMSLHGGWLKADADGQYKLAARVAPMVLDHATSPGDVAVGV